MKILEIEDDDHAYFKSIAGLKGCKISEVLSEARILYDYMRRYNQT